VSLLGDFHDAYKHAMEEVQWALDEDMENARQKIHTLKGAAGNISAHALRLALQELEWAVGKGGSMEPELNKAGQALEQVLESIGKVAARMGPPLHEEPEAEGGSDTTDLADLLDQLSKAVNECDPVEAKDRLGRIKKHLVGIEQAQAFHAIELCLEDFHFAGAEEGLVRVSRLIGY
jgi:HPt (histidine-containing phosphotransfer) domain-containing protein